MLNVVICDDSVEVVHIITKMIEDAKLIKELEDVSIELATTNPNEVLTLFRIKEKHADGKEIITPQPLKQRLLFLDINFGSDYLFDGVQLGAEIRKYDIRSDIVFVTSSGEERSDVLDNKIVALGYLKKRLLDDSFRDRIVDFLDTALQRIYTTTLDKKIIEFQMGPKKIYTKLTDILYIKGNDLKEKNKSDTKTQPGLAFLCKTDSVVYLKKGLQFYEKSIEELVRLGKSYLINPINVSEIRPSGKKIILKLINGEEISVTREAFKKYEAKVSLKEITTK